MNSAFPAKNLAIVLVDGSDELFSVHQIYCVGRNYAEHAKEMEDSGREVSFFFTKPDRHGAAGRAW